MTLRDQQMTRVAHHAGAVGVGHVQDVHRHVDHHFLRYMNQRALAGERGVERREPVAIGRSRHAQVARQQFRLLHGRRGKIQHPHAVGQVADR